MPQFLGLELCQQIRKVIVSRDAYPYLGAAATAVLDEHRLEMRDCLTKKAGDIEVAGNEIRWWTFAGGRINATLRHALEAVGDDWKVVPDNFLIKVRADRLDRARFETAVAKLRGAEFWTDEAFWSDVAGTLPNFRLSKFQPLMPPWVEREVIASYLLDVVGARGWLRSMKSGENDRLHEAEA